MVSDFPHLKQKNSFKLCYINYTVYKLLKYVYTLKNFPSYRITYLIDSIVEIFTHRYILNKIS